MTPVEFKDQNKVFSRPENLTEAQCLPLPTKVHEVDLGDNMKGVAIDSVWELSTEELNQLKETGKIRLRVFGNGMPMVSLMVEEG